MLDGISDDPWRSNASDSRAEDRAAISFAIKMTSGMFLFIITVTFVLASIFWSAESVSVRLG